MKRADVKKLLEALDSVADSNNVANVARAASWADLDFNECDRTLRVIGLRRIGSDSVNTKIIDL